MAKMHRRYFLRGVLAAGAATVAVPGWGFGRVLGANDRIRVAIAGLNGRGGAHLDELFGRTGVEVAWLVDPDKAVLAGAIKGLEGRQRKAQEKRKKKAKDGKEPEPEAAETAPLPQTVQDVRKVLEDKSIDCLTIATPNHWHSLMTIWACQAGKHVYVEKPCSHDVFEGRTAVAASRKYTVIVQHGTQQRCERGRARLMKAIHDGQFGKLIVSHGYCCKPRDSIGKIDGPQPIPPTIDYDLWCGPGPKGPLMRRQLHYDWHWFWDYGNGDIGNQGVHEMDVARWAFKDKVLPRRVMSLGGRFGWDDNGETPNSQLAILDFGDGQYVFFTVRNLNYEGYKREVKNDFYFEDCRIVDGKLYRKGKSEPESFSTPDVKITEGGAFGSFIAAVRAGKREMCNADILEGHYSSALGHIANVPYRLGEKVPFDEKAGKFGDNKAAYEAFMSLHAILKDGCKLPVDKTQYTVGPWLSFDPRTERFVGERAEEANKLLLPAYRKGFEVPAPDAV